MRAVGFHLGTMAMLDRLDLLLDHPRQGHLKEMILNATEFKTGSAFRFQVSEYHCLVGNGNVSICFEHAR